MQTNRIIKPAPIELPGSYDDGIAFDKINVGEESRQSKLSGSVTSIYAGSTQSFMNGSTGVRNTFFAPGRLATFEKIDPYSMAVLYSSLTWNGGVLGGDDADKVDPVPASENSLTPAK